MNKPTYEELEARLAASEELCAQLRDGVAVMSDPACADWHRKDIGEKLLAKTPADMGAELARLREQNHLFRQETVICADCDGVKKAEYDTLRQQLAEAQDNALGGQYLVDNLREQLAERDAELHRIKEALRYDTEKPLHEAVGIVRDCVDAGEARIDDLAAELTTINNALGYDDSWCEGKRLSEAVGILRARVAELENDKERLDWLESGRYSLTFEPGEESVPDSYAVDGINKRIIRHCDGLRAAIDAAMQAK